MLDSDLALPTHYVINREAPEDELAQFEQVLAIHPCSIGVVTRYEDVPLASRFVDDVRVWLDIRTVWAIVEQFQHETNRPVLVVGDRTEICSSKPTSTN